MSESNLTTNETIKQDDNVKTRFLLLDYLDYLLAISRDFRIGTKEGIYIPTFEVSNDENQYEAYAQKSKAIMELYRQRLDTIPGRVNRVQRAKNLLRFDMRDAASKAVTCQLGYADEIARRIMEINKHNKYYIMLLQDMESNVLSCRNSMSILKQRQTDGDEYSGIKKMPRDLLQNGHDEIHRYQCKIKDLLEREEALVDAKTNELDAVIKTCFCNENNELPENFDNEKIDLLTTPPKDQWTLIEYDIVKNEISYHDPQADALASESEACLQERFFLRNHAMLYEFCLTLLD